jgi:hypothetical protein
MSHKVREYIYTDAKSRPRLRKLRKDPKAFYMDSWVHDPLSGHWSRGIRDEQQEFAAKAMYRLPELLWALTADAPVYWCEGEKCADAVTATLNVCGVGTTHWQGATSATPEQAAWFRRGDGPIYLIADVDDAGAACVLARRQLLLDAGVRHQRLALLAPPHPHKDAAEALQAGVPLSEFRKPMRTRLSAAAARYEAERSHGGERGESDWYGADGKFLTSRRSA